MTSMIKVDGLVIRAPGLETKPLSFAMEEGGHALLGRAEDGPPAILRALAGEITATRGTIQIHGQRPAAVRRRIALISLDARLPDALRVDETLALAASIRGDRAPKISDVLAPLGLEALAQLRVATLRPAEQRAIAIAEALASPTVDIVLLEEPFAELEATAGARLLEALRAKKGCVVVATASTRDARAIAKDYLVLERGRPIHVANCEEAHKRMRGCGVRFRLVLDDARKWMASAAAEPLLRRLAIDGDSVVIEGDDPEEVARAIGRTIVASGVDVHPLARDIPTLEEIRASIAGQYAGVYQAAVEQAKSVRSSALPPPSGPPSTHAGAQVPTPPPRLGGES
ncbi:hypothetical protein BH09MYX1_BH09MYX1_39100 [soil metagenome]